MDSRTKGPDFQATYLHQVRPFTKECSHEPFPNASRGSIKECTDCSQDTSVGLAGRGINERRRIMRRGQGCWVWCLSAAMCNLAFVASATATEKRGPSAEE